MQSLTPNSPSSSPTRSNSPWLLAAGLSAVGLFLASKLAERVHRSPVHLQGKVALITGGSRGFGLALAQELGEQGARIALVARDAEELSRAAEQLQSHGIEAATFVSDVTDQPAQAVLISRILEHFGRIDILVNNAGMIKVAPLESLQHSDFEEAMDLMFWAPVNLALAVLPHMQSQGAGHIVNITSIGGKVSIPHLLPYSCAKFAFVGFSNGLSHELDPSKIHVLTVAPGLMRTGSYLNAKFKGLPAEFAWFGLLGNLPGFSVSAEQAAREVRVALQNRQLDCTISLPAKILSHASALLPEATHSLLQLANEYALPKAHGSRQTRTGQEANAKFGTLFQALTSLGRLAAGKLNE